MPVLTRPPPCPRAAAVTAAFWPLGSITSADPGHVSRLGMMAEQTEGPPSHELGRRDAEGGGGKVMALAQAWRIELCW